jgi:hypothetical protein
LVAPLKLISILPDPVLGAPPWQSLQAFVSLGAPVLPNGGLAELVKALLNVSASVIKKARSVRTVIFLSIMVFVN